MRRIPREFYRVPFAHRGLHDPESGVIENSLSAFRSAWENGFGIELDVRLSADREAMVFHDRDLERMTAARGRVEDLDSEQLVGLKLGGSQDRIPLLREVLERVDGRVPLLVELKTNNERGRRLCTALVERVATLVRPYRDSVAAMSFSSAAMRHLRKTSPEIFRGILRNHGDGDALDPLEGLDEDFAAWKSSCLPTGTANDIRRKGRPVFAWTVTSEREETRLREHVDVIIFEGFRPSRRA